jgi:hypothetical protein
MANVLDTLSKLSSIGQSRSSVLNPLQWMLVILVSGLGAVLWLHGPNWLVICLAVLMSTNVALVEVAYCYFMTRAPHLLRSESYALAEQAMKHGYFDKDILHEILNRQNELNRGGGISVDNLDELQKHQRAPRRLPKKGQAKND